MYLEKKEGNIDELKLVVGILKSREASKYTEEIHKPINPFFH